MDGEWRRRGESEEEWVSVRRWGPGPEASGDGGAYQAALSHPARTIPFRSWWDARIRCGLFCTGWAWCGTDGTRDRIPSVRGGGRGGPSLRVVPRLSAPTEHNTRVRRPLSRRRACPLHRPPTCRLGPCAEEEGAEAGPRVTCDVAMDGPLIIDLRAGLKSYGWRRIWPAAPRGFSKFLPNIFEKLNFFQDSG